MKRLRQGCHLERKGRLKRDDIHLTNHFLECDQRRSATPWECSQVQLTMPAETPRLLFQAR